MTKFNSQICTAREQSERLLSLGLKKETADCHWEDFAFFEDYEDLVARIGKPDNEYEIPAWSLHRLIEMLNIEMQTDGRYVYLAEGGFDDYASIYDNIIDCIEWLIKEGYFNKEYLENDKARTQR